VSGAAQRAMKRTTFGEADVHCVNFSKDELSCQFGQEIQVQVMFVLICQSSSAVVIGHNFRRGSRRPEVCTCIVILDCTQERWNSIRSGHFDVML
jgi:hypothetical protein